MRYAAIPAQSRFSVQAFATGMLSGLGHNPTFAIRGFTGELLFHPEAPDSTSIRITVKTDSLALIDSVSPKDRDEIERQMRRDALETVAYPEIVFQSAEAKTDKIAENWYRLQVAGEIQLHGVKRPHALDTQLRLFDDQARLSGRCTLSQSAHRIKPVVALGGLIRLKDELKFEFDIVFSQQEG
jgi:polyisoprenoid-binding protein YceI